MLDRGIIFCYNSMEMKDLRYLQLWDAYGPLLTESQREICEKYYMYDLSLTEIAEEKGISKQAVSDALKTSRELLDLYEGKLHFNEQNQAYSLAVSFMMTDVTRALEAFKQKYPTYVREIDEIIAKVTVGDTVDLDEGEN